MSRTPLKVIEIPIFLGILQVATTDGRIIVLGKGGAQATLQSNSLEPTKQLDFLVNHGLLCRIHQVLQPRTEGAKGHG